jgi:uncharacterized membrane protein YbaN (DUF454 family)
MNNTFQNLAHKIMKPLFFTLGIIMFTVGLIGVVVPGLPTTIFMIIAAACFIRSSEKFYKLVINNKLFGKSVQDYRSGKGMLLKTKLMAWGMMWIFGMYAVIFAIPDRLIYVRIFVCMLLIIGTIVILRVPIKKV